MRTIEYQLPKAPHLKIFGVESGIAATWGYLCYDTNTKTGIIFDVPQNSVDVLIQKANELGITISTIYLTHSHWDHTADAAKLKRETKAPLFIHPDDEYRLAEPMLHTIWQLPFEIEGVAADFHLNHNDVVQCGDWNFLVRHTPGHTEGGVCFINEKHSVAIVGDTLFAESIGRTDLPGGNADLLLESIENQLLSLSDDVVFFAGHGEISTIGNERKFNPFLVGLKAL
ncbi:MAG: MBL fold metallo-hydrolase [Bacteroidetes bacterium]|nr:MBL fold metallo-hydrolase [Bacteroidota bacterium]